VGATAELLQWVRMVAVALGLVLVASVLAGVLTAIPGVSRADEYIHAHQRGLLLITGGVALLGFVVFMGAILDLLIVSGQPMSHAEVEDQAARLRVWQPSAWKASKYRIRGRTGGTQAHTEFNLTELKAAWRNGAAWRDPPWRRNLAVTAGALTMGLGLFAILFVISPLPIKLIIAGAVGYASTRLVGGFWRA
jgi:hypothetical protein